jgi:flagellar hook-associated protein 3 FlgL
LGGTRVNPNIVPDLLASLSRAQAQENRASLELSTGSRINAPSDDPAGAALLTQIQDRSTQTDSFERSITSINGQFQTADSTLSSVVTVLQRAISLGVQGGDGTLSATDRASIASELSGIKEQLRSLANTSYQGNYIFAGTAQAQPYVVDNTVASGVVYQGNSGINQVAIGSGYQVQVNQPGLQIFNAAGADVFQSITDLITAVTSNSAIATAVSAVRGAYDNVTTQRVFYGNALNLTDSQKTYLDSQKLDLSSQITSVAGVDVATAATQLANAETARSATLAAIGKALQTNSLFDYLK